MEKPSPHCKLSVVKSLVEAGKVRTTYSARLGAMTLGFELSGMLAASPHTPPETFTKA
jgi:motility quorum-sensing regulator/GCU-specific mRNA interferase toxin